MKTHHVEVDDEVFSFIQKQAQPLVDDFNSALKRYIGISNKATPNATPAQKNEMLILDAGTPNALRHILEVMHIMSNGYSRQEATKITARDFGVTIQAIQDKYGRQLQLSSAVFDQLLAEPNYTKLREKLKNKFPAHKAMIDEKLDSFM